MKTKTQRWMGFASTAIALLATCFATQAAPDLTVSGEWLPSHTQNLSVVVAHLALDPTFTVRSYLDKKTGALRWSHRGEVLTTTQGAEGWRKSGLFTYLDSPDDLRSNQWIMVEAKLVVPQRRTKEGDFKPVLVVQKWKKISANEASQATSLRAEPER